MKNQITNLITKILLKDKILSLQLSLFLKKWKREVMLDDSSKNIEIIQKYFHQKLKGLRIRKLIKEALSEVDTVNNNAEGKPLIARQDF